MIVSGKTALINLLEPRRSQHFRSRGLGHAGTGPPVSRWSVVRRCMEQARIIHAPLWGFSDEFTEFEAAQPRRQ